MKKLLLACAALVLLTSCKPELPSIAGYNMFFLPSNNYKVGQIIAIYTKPKKIDIIHNTKLEEGDFLPSKSANFTSEETSKLTAHIEASVKDQVDAAFGLNASRYISVRYLNTRVVDLVHTNAYSRIKNAIAADPDVQEYLTKLKYEKGVKLDVASSILTADIEVTINDGVEAGVDISAPKLLDKLDIGFGPDVTRANTIVGKQLAIGYHADPNLVNFLVR